MSAVPAELDTDAQPPMTIPLRHFLTAQVFLVAGIGFWIASVLDVFPGRSGLAHVHALLAGWVCLTIVGAMTQFVPVWSGVALHSRRFAVAELWLIAGGLSGFVTAIVLAEPVWMVTVGVVMLTGFWLFAYNIGRTLLRARPLTATEWHFAVALGWVVLVTTAGVLLTTDLVTPLIPTAVPRHQVVAAHATMAVFGIVLTTILGAIFPLVDLFAPVETARSDEPIRRVETVAYPVGVVLLTGGRLFAVPTVARLGGVLVLAALALVVVFLARRLVAVWGQWTPMLTRYAVAAVALAAWVILALPSWWRRPLAPGNVFGPTGGRSLLILGVIGFVVLGTLYHVVPFIVWVHRYADVLGFEPVPVVDDLYDDLLAVADLLAFVLGTGFLLVGTMSAFGHGDQLLALLGGVVLAVGALLFVGNLALVVHRHGDRSLGTILLGGRSTERVEAETSEPR